MKVSTVLKNLSRCNEEAQGIPKRPLPNSVSDIKFSPMFSGAIEKENWPKIVKKWVKKGKTKLVKKFKKFRPNPYYDRKNV